MVANSAERTSYGKSECGAAYAKAGSGLVESQRDRPVTSDRMKNQQDGDAAFLAVRMIADTGVALHDEFFIDKSAEVVETIQIR